LVFRSGTSPLFSGFSPGSSYQVTKFSTSKIIGGIFLIIKFSRREIIEAFLGGGFLEGWLS
jgi:hypothetical protein